MNLLKNVLKEKNLVIILFVMVFVAFAFAQKESKDIETLYLGFKAHNPSLQMMAKDKPGTATRRKSLPAVSFPATN